MIASLVTYTINIELISSSLVAIIMPPKRSTSKEKTKRIIDEVVENPPVTIPILYNTQLFIKKDSGITWHMLKDAFTTI